MMVEALCLHEKGRKLVSDHHPLRALVPILTHKAYVLPDSSGSSALQLSELASGLEELVRHMPHELSYQAVDAVLAVLRVCCTCRARALAFRLFEYPNGSSYWIFVSEVLGLRDMFVGTACTLPMFSVFHHLEPAR